MNCDVGHDSKTVPSEFKLLYNLASWTENALFFYNSVEGGHFMLEKILENVINEMAPHLD